MAAAAGVDDVHLIAALALHRRMTEAELRHAVGDRVYDAFAPDGLLYNFDAEDPDNLTFLGETDEGEEVEISKRAAESDLLVYVNINLVAMDGGHKSTATGLASYRSLRHHHNVHTLQHSRSLMDRHNSALHHSNWRMGEVIRKAGVKIFQIETTLNNDTFGGDLPLSVLQKREWEWTLADRASFIGLKAGLDRMPSNARRKVFNAWKAPYALTSVQAGEVGPVHDAHHPERPRPATGAGRGPDRRAHDGAALHLPLQRELGDEPDPGHVPGPRVLLQPLPGEARSSGRAGC